MCVLPVSSLYLEWIMPNLFTCDCSLGPSRKVLSSAHGCLALWPIFPAVWYLPCRLHDVLTGLMWSIWAPSWCFLSGCHLSTVAGAQCSRVPVPQGVPRGVARGLCGAHTLRTVRCRPLSTTRNRWTDSVLELAGGCEVVSHCAFSVRFLHVDGAPFPQFLGRWLFLSWETLVSHISVVCLLVPVECVSPSGLRMLVLFGTYMGARAFF